MAKITSKGQVTIPNQIRDYLGIQYGDEIDFIQENGNIVIRKRLDSSPFDQYIGYLHDGKTSQETIREIRGLD